MTYSSAKYDCYCYKLLITEAKACMRVQFSSSHSKVSHAQQRAFEFKAYFKLDFFKELDGEMRHKEVSLRIITNLLMEFPLRSLIKMI